MQHMRIIYLALALLLLLIPSDSARAQSASDSFIVQRFVTAGGGLSESSSFTSSSVIGQPNTTIATSSSYSVSGGFLFSGQPGVATAVGLNTSAATSLVPFWLLLSTAFFLLAVAALLFWRTRSENAPQTAKGMSK